MSVALRCQSLFARRALMTGIAAVAVSGMFVTTSAAALPPGCSQSGQTVTCRYSSGSNPFIVPAGVASIHAVAVGGKGGGNSGGAGAMVSGELSVSAGSTLYAVVGANGGAQTPGGAGGGTGATDKNGESDTFGGDGGGASDVRSAANNLAGRLLVAAGGGGGGGFGLAIVGGGTRFLGRGAGGGGAGGGNTGVMGTSGGGGGGGNAAGGSAGAAGSTCISIFPPPEFPLICGSGSVGSAGGTGRGGDGGAGADFAANSVPVVFSGGGGGGGGGGLFGGGGGGGAFGAGNGGGGGSNLVPAGGSRSIDATGVPMVQLSYVLVPTSKSHCKNGAWRTFGTMFKNQGQCMAFVVKQARQKCLTERAKIGLLAFRSKYGIGRYHVLAMRRCVNQASR